MTYRRIAPISLLPILWLAVPATGRAAELDFDGWYRARGRAFSSLTLDRDLERDEGLAAYAEHRLWLAPRLILSDQAALMVEIRGLDNVLWGNAPDRASDFTFLSSDLGVFDDDLGTPDVGEATGIAGRDARLDITLWRAWGEVHTDAGRFRFGRMPLEWGIGVWQNGGVPSLERTHRYVGGLPEMMDHGDTADRVQWEHLIERLYVSAAASTNAERVLNAEDDTTSFEGSVAWRSESVVAGLRGQVRRVGNDFTLGTVSLAGDAVLGPIELHAEGVAQFGGGDLAADLADVRVASGGGALDAQLKTSALNARVIAGIATGDADPADSSLRAFQFDRDYSIGLFLFEQPLPAVAAASPSAVNEGRDLNQLLVGDAISNAIFVRPSVSRELVEGFEVEVAAVGARTAASAEEDEDRKGYGWEFDASARYTKIEHVELGLTLGAFLPGTYFTNFDPDNTSFDDLALGGQLVGNIRF